VIGAARQKELGDAAVALEDRANLLDSKAGTTEGASLRCAPPSSPSMRAMLACHAAARPRRAGAASARCRADLLAAARRRAGDRPEHRAAAPEASRARRVVGRCVRADRARRDLAALHGDGQARSRCTSARSELRPGDPLAAVP